MDLIAVRSQFIQVLTHRTTKYIAGATLALYVFGKLTRPFYNEAYARFLNRMEGKFSQDEQQSANKRELFSVIREGDTVVEMGAGTGANFQYLPAGCFVICVEPKLEFNPYIEKNLKERGAHLADVRMVEGMGEKLSSCVERSSVDVVICTQVLCSVTDVDRVAREAYAVLKPGGRLLCMDHVLAPPEYPGVRLFQRLVTLLSVFLLDNCHWNREPWLLVGQVFTDMKWKRIRNLHLGKFHGRSFMATIAATK